MQLSFIAKLLFSFVLSYLLTKLLIKYGHKLNIYDIPNERSHHHSITPSGAGIGFIGALLISLLVFEFQLVLEYWYVFLSILMVFTIGVYDDKYNVSAKLKFIVIFLAVFVMWLNGFNIDTLGVWYGHNLTIPAIVALFFSMFSIAGFTNALNLIDGIDTLASGISIVILLFFAIIGIEYHSDIITVLSTFTITVIVGFLFFNWYPAKIFMGDSGSLSLGFIISILAVFSLKYIHPIAIIYIAALPILDTLVVMIRRIRQGKSPFSPDKTHIHHIMVKFFDMDVKRTVCFLVMLQIIFSSAGYMILDAINNGYSQNIPLFATIGFLVMFMLFYMIFTGIKKRQKVIDKNH